MAPNFVRETAEANANDLLAGLGVMRQLLVETGNNEPLPVDLRDGLIGNIEAVRAAVGRAFEAAHEEALAFERGGK